MEAGGTQRMFWCWGFAIDEVGRWRATRACRGLSDWLPVAIAAKTGRKRQPQRSRRRQGFDLTIPPPPPPTPVETVSMLSLERRVARCPSLALWCLIVLLTFSLTVNAVLNFQ